jgi:hypothetical protein
MDVHVPARSPKGMGFYEGILIRTYFFLILDKLDLIGPL